MCNELENVDEQIASNGTTMFANLVLETNESTSSDSDIDITGLINLSDSERTQVFTDLSTSLTNVVSNIERGNKEFNNSSNNTLVNELINAFIQRISTTNSDGIITYKVNDLIKNDFYNDVVKAYGKAANIKITPNMLHYAGRNGLPLIREDVNDYNLELYGTNPPTEAGQEYNFYKMGVVRGDEKTSQYSKELYSSTGSYQRKYTWYPDGMAYHYNTKSWYACDDGIYRDADGYIICADQNNMGYNANGNIRNVMEINNSGDAFIVDTPFGPGKVYDKCGIKENIDIDRKKEKILWKWNMKMNLKTLMNLVLEVQLIALLAH